jgi:DNA-binding PadR family transcriptional regulator
MGMSGDRRSLVEWAVLGVLAEGVRHPYHLARDLGPGGSLGRVLTVRRSQVYRAVDRLAAAGLIEACGIEPGSGGPERTVYRATATGREHLANWLQEPVGHVRDLRQAFLLKLLLLRRSGCSPAELIHRQRTALAGALGGLERLPAEPDEVDLWRHHNAGAASVFLDEAARQFGDGAAGER